MAETGTLLSERYEIKEKIGSGGMADVYKAVDTRLNRLVAVKILKSEFSDDKSFISRFKNEAMSAAGLSHPNIVSVYDVGEDNGLHYIVMELVEGITLKKFIEKKGRLEIREAVGISIQIAQGMEAAHEHGIIHRDIKPQNIMISKDGKVKVADFGIAKVVSSETYTQNAVGSAHYLSPEQARGGYYDERSDIYSLGVTLYEMLTGQLPFGGDSDVTVALQHIQTEARPARELVPSIPYSLDRIVQKCMQKHPENRYSLASDLIIDLKHSITNPDGDFVRINNGMEGRTRAFTNEETDEIKNQAAATRPVVPQTYKEEYARPQKSVSNSKVLHEEYEELDTIDSKFEKVVIIITIFAAIALIVGAAFIFVKLFGGSLWGANTNVTPTPQANVSATATPAPTQAVMVKVPNVLSLTKEDAERSLYQKSSDFMIIYEDAQYSSQREGTVIEQYPLADSDVPQDQTIRLTLSAGGEPFTIPTLAETYKDDAKYQLEAMKLKVILFPEPNETVREGYVTRTNPLNGTIVHAGDEIIVYYSTGFKYPTNVPNIYNKSLEVATLLLENVGLKVGGISYDYSIDVTPGNVMNIYKPGEIVEVGSFIDIVLSQGPGEGIITPAPADDKGYYSASFDTRNMVYPSKEESTTIWFEIIQPSTASDFVVYINYDDPSAEGQTYSITKDTFRYLYKFKLYKNFIAEDIDYSQLRPGEASITAYVDGEELATQTVILEAFED